MYRKSRITQFVTKGSLVALAATATLAFSATAADAAPSKASSDAAAGSATATAAAKKHRKRCKAPKVAVRRHHKVRCVRPKKPASVKREVVAPAPAPQQADPRPADAQDNAAAPGEQTAATTELSNLSSKASEEASRVGITVTVGGGYYDKFVGCNGAYWHSDGFYYAWCGYIQMAGEWAIGAKRLYYWWSDYSGWNYWFSKQIY
jgi:hypothetical protein